MEGLLHGLDLPAVLTAGETFEQVVPCLKCMCNANRECNNSATISPYPPQLITVLFINLDQAADTFSNCECN